MNPSVVILIIIIVVIYVIVKGRTAGNQQEPGEDVTANMPTVPFPDGLDKAKVQTSFVEIQQAWQKKDLKD